MLKHSWKKRLGLITVLATMFVSLVACGKDDSSQAQTTEGQAQEITSESTEAVDPIDSKDSNDSIEGLATPSTAGKLRVIGSNLCDKNGNPIQLRGMSTHGIGWFPQFINQDAFFEFHNEWGANVVRLAMYTGEGEGYCTGGDKDKLKALVEDGVAYAREADMYVIIDWHILSDNNPNTYKAEAIEFFDQMSAKYADYDNVIYEICNEPNGGTSWEEIKSYAEEVIPVIRKNAKDAIIIVGTPTWSQEVDKAAANPITGYDNIMYTLHFYAATHKDDLRNKMKTAAEGGLAIFVTEFGICDASGNGAIDEDSANEWVSLMNEYGISFVCWNLSNKNESSAIFKESCTKTSGFTEEDLNQEGIWLKNLLTSMVGITVPDQTSKEKAPKEEGSSSSSTNVSKSGDIKLTATLANSWDSAEGTCYQYSCVIENTGSAAVSGWKVDVTFDGNISLSEGWNGSFQASGNTLTIQNADYNGQIAGGASISDVGFIVCGGKLK